jgi:hypothetical protein
VLLGLGFALVPFATGHIFLYWDNAQQHYPQTVFLHQALRSGHIPQWFPGVGMGFPTVAEGQAAHFHPIRLLLALAFPPAAAFMLEAGLCVALAGIFTYLFLRRFRLLRSACFLGGVCQMFGASSVIYIRNIALHRSLCLLPLGMYFAEKFARSGRLRYAAAFSLIVALQLLSGHPTVAVITSVGTMVYLVSRVFQRSWSAKEPLRPAVAMLGRISGAWLLAVTLGAGLAAIQIVPTLLHTRNSIRQGGFRFEYATGLSARLGDLPQVAFPYAYAQGDWLDDSGPWRRDFNPVPSSNFYVGALPLLLAAVALWWKQRWPSPVVPLAASLVVACGIALGPRTPLFPAIWSLPGMNSMRFPSRFLLLASFCLACLAAIGFHRAEALKRLKSEPKRLWSPVVLACGFISLFACALWLLRPKFQSGVLISTGIFCVALLFCGALLQVRRGKWLIRVLVTVIVLVDLWSFRVAFGYSRLAPAEPNLRPPDAMGLLRDETEPYRIMSLYSVEQVSNRTEHLRELLAANLCTIWAVDSTDAWASLFPKRKYAVWEEFLWELENSPTGAKSLAGILGALNVKYVVAPVSVTLADWTPARRTKHATIWRNPSFLPRAFLVGQVVPERLEYRSEWEARSRRRLEAYHRMVADWWSRLEDAQILDHILERAVDYSTTAFVSGESVPPLQGPDPHWEVKKTSGAGDPDTMRFQVRTRKPAFLVVSNSFYPGWTATVNGQPTQVHRTNWLVQGVFVPAGESEVVFRFLTPGLRLGVAISLFSVSLFITIIWWDRRRTKSRKGLEGYDSH